MTQPENMDELEAMQATVESEFDMNAMTPQEHRFERCVGNQLQCVLHENCVGMFIKPWQTLELNENGELILVSKLPE